MAKTQGLHLNPSKISGLCGRLMCCLGYESEMYEKILAKMPKTWWIGNRATIDVMSDGEEILNLLQDGDVITKTTVPIEQWNSIFG